MSVHDTDEITKEEVVEALSRSGYLLETRVEAVLRERGFYVETNAAYPDRVSGKSREYDLNAITAEQIPGREMDFLFCLLLVECINNPQPLVLITGHPQWAEGHASAVKAAGVPVVLTTEEGQADFPTFVVMADFHHYCKGRIASQYCSFKRKKRTNDWMALHEDSHFNSFKKLTDVIDYSIEDHNTVMADSLPDNASFNVEMYYGVVVLQGELLEAVVANDDLEVSEAGMLLLRQSVVTEDAGEREDIIDVVQESCLGSYLDIVESEVEKTAKRLSEKWSDVERTIAVMVDKAKEDLTKEGLEALIDGSIPLV